ncbi:cupin domain-containing protein [Lysobacter sp. F6437]|uniref:cupin domain-containing protein n=1 Tax=Lysobacter sp. F6437 TaxID=3459296 RepID=UPI00403D5B86
MDVLSDVLRAVRLTGAVFFDIHAHAPWVAESPAVASICASVMPDFEHVICFHILMEGSCWAQLADESLPAIRLEVGDAVIFAGGDGHYMGTERGKRSVPNMEIYYRPVDTALPFVFNEFGGHGVETRFVCGYLGCDSRPFNPILGALPRVLHVRGGGGGGHLTHELIQVALEETRAPRAGGETILSKLSELMFLHAVRQHIDGLPEASTGWLAGLRDRHVGAALRLMHGRPAQAWTLDTLAREVGLSRSAFAERFSRIMGTPAMHYLGQWRLQLAANALGRGLSIAQAASEVGYESEAAFNRAFKRQVGMPPGAWRRSALAPAAAS